MVRLDRRLTATMIAEEFGMNPENVRLIMTEDLGMRELCPENSRINSELNEEMYQQVCWNYLNLTQVY